MGIIKEFFYLRKSDRKVILTLLVVIVVAVGVIFWTGNYDESNELFAEDSLQEETTIRERNATGYYVAPKNVERFPFDPNTADSTQLLRLGLQPWQVRNIYKYRAAGGTYTRPEDFALLYGMTNKQFRELKPYIRISKDYQQATPNQLYAYEPIEDRDTVKYPIKIQPLERIPLNKADTSMLRKVPGIGSYFARQIVQYRKRLGGYYSISQLMEIENFPESSLHYFIIPDDECTIKLNVNRLTLNELCRHPYINFYQAKTITDYRRLHGPIKSLQDLRLSKDFPPEVITHLEPYVEY